MTTADHDLRDVPRRRVGALRFSVLPLAEAVDRVCAAGDPATPPTTGIAVHFGNAYSVALADAHASYRRLVDHADLVLSDGTPVVWAGRRMHPADADRWTRVYGPDVMTGVLAASGTGGPRHYLVGGTPSTLAALEQRIADRWPNAQVVGAESPPFRDESAAERGARTERIRSSAATVVWVGLGTPKQDGEVRRLADSLPVVALGVGAAFDFIAEAVPQAPPWMQRSGLEWAFRWSQEPRRLTGRYLWGNPRFVVSVARHWRADAHRGRP